MTATIHHPGTPETATRARARTEGRALGVTWRDLGAGVLRPAARHSRPAC